MPQHELFRGSQSRPHKMRIALDLPQGEAVDSLDLGWSIVAYNGELLAGYAVPLRGRVVEAGPSLISLAAETFLWGRAHECGPAVERRLRDIHRQYKLHDDAEPF